MFLENLEQIAMRCESQPEAQADRALTGDGRDAVWVG
jgi:hypothetical protein